MKSKAIEVYYDETLIIERINQLKDLDYEEEEIHIIVNNIEEYEIEDFEKINDVEVKGEGITMDAFMDLITGVDSLLEIFDDLDLDDEDRDFYYKSLENGDLLLYIDRDYIIKSEINDIDEELYSEELFEDIEEVVEEDEEYDYIDEIDKDTI